MTKKTKFKVDLNFTNNKEKLKELENLHSLLQEYFLSYKLLKSTPPSKDTDDELKSLKRKILTIIFRMRKLVQNFESSESTL